MWLLSVGSIKECGHCQSDPQNVACRSLTQNVAIISWVNMTWGHCQLGIQNVSIFSQVYKKCGRF